MGETGKQDDRLRLHGDEADLYQLYHDRLVRVVARAVRVPMPLVEDACQTTWAILLRRQPERGERLFGWLRTVATHEAWRLSSQQRRDVWLEELRSEDGDWLEDRATIELTIEARRAIEALASLPERQRVDLALRVAGYSYREIQARTPGRTYTNVNKHLVKARTRIRQIEAAG